MSNLNRMLLVNLLHMWGQVLALTVVLGCGIAGFTFSGNAVKSLTISRERYYQDYAFADIFLSVKRAPMDVLSRIRELPTVERAEGRVVRDVILDISTMPEPATCRLVSIPDDVSSGLNRIYLRKGRMPDPNKRGEVIASETFVDAHRLIPGDHLKVLMGGREELLEIVGIGISPEYIYSVQPGQMLPDYRHFGVLWMPYRQIASAFNMEGALNDISIILAPRASTTDVIKDVDRIMTPYGGLGAYSREDQISHQKVSDEMHQLSGMAYVSPMIFMLVAAFLFNLVFSRMIHHQQETIATLRAFGYKPREIGFHYLKMLIILVLFGMIFGLSLGLYLTKVIIQLYGQFFRFPYLFYIVDWQKIPFTLLISSGFATLGGISSIRKAMQLPPAVAMRPEAPQSYSRSIVEIIGWGQYFSKIMVMVLRNMQRNYSTTLLSIAGMSLGTSVLVLGSFMTDTIDYVIDVQFERAQRQDVMLSFNERLTESAIHDVEHLAGVTRVEGFRAVPVRINHGRYTRRSSIMGMDEQPQLFRVLDKNVNEVHLEPGGLIISQKMAEILHAAEGDTLEIELLEERNLKCEVVVTRVFGNYTNPSAYMNRQTLHKLLKEGPCLSGVFLTADANSMDELYEQFKNSPVTTSVTLQKAIIQSFNDTITENLRPMRVINATFASVIAFGVIYNCSLITLTQRSRDLATLRVLGFTRLEVSTLLMGELAIIALSALPIGLPIGYLLSYIATIALDTETQRLPLAISKWTFAYAATVILLAASYSALIIRKQIDKLDLIAVLKVKE